MGTAHEPHPVKLFLAMMYEPAAPWREVLAELVERFGPLERQHGPISFGHTDYYRDEMGAELSKTYLCFSRLIQRELLAGIKVFTNEIEQRHAREGRRTINLDPGYVARDKLVLASTKDFYHRLYIGQGIFAEVTLHFRKGLFRFFSWTYSDYKEPEFIAMLRMARAELVGRQRRDARTEG